MNNKYELFLSNDAVVNIKSEKEFQQFVAFMEQLGLSNIKYMDNIYKKYGFEHGFCYNGGIKYCDSSELCFEYQIGKGFTFSSIKEYEKYNNEINICSLDELKLSSGYAIKVDDKILEKPLTEYKVYLRFSTEEQLKKFYGVDKLEKQVKNINEYKPIKGFYDLRDFNLPDEKFKELWKFQLYLDHYEQNKNEISISVPELWESLKELSGEYQQELLSYPKKDEVELERE